MTAPQPLDAVCAVLAPLRGCREVGPDCALHISWDGSFAEGSKSTCTEQFNPTSCLRLKGEQGLPGGRNRQTGAVPQARRPGQLGGAELNRQARKPTRVSCGVKRRHNRTAAVNQRALMLSSLLCHQAFFAFLSPVPSLLN